MLMIVHARMQVKFSFVLNEKLEKRLNVWASDSEGQFMNDKNVWFKTVSIN